MMMTSSITDLFDFYSLRARVYPGFLALSPVVIAIYIIWEPPGLQKVWPLLIGAGGSFLLANLVRGRGNNVEDLLIGEWGGWPTTHALRMATRQNSVIRDRRRARLEQLLNVQLPDLATERLSPKAADDRYHDAVRQLIVLVRAKADSFPRVQEENIHYGFRRNLYALKPVGLCVLVVTMVVCVISLGRDGLHWPVILSGSIGLALSLVWIFAINPSWVRQAGDKYAERLLETLDDPALSS